jgi:hypothetical protein
LTAQHSKVSVLADGPADPMAAFVEGERKRWTEYAAIAKIEKE